MKKVIALMENGTRILTTGETAGKNNWWITHKLEVEVLTQTTTSFDDSQEPEIGSILTDSDNCSYTVTKSEKVLFCRVCLNRANFRIGYSFYCKKHYKHLLLTKPGRREFVRPDLNNVCSCSSGLQIKDCCIVKSSHEPELCFNSRRMENSETVFKPKDICHERC